MYAVGDVGYAQKLSKYCESKVLKVEEVSNGRFLKDKITGANMLLNFSFILKRKMRKFNTSKEIL